MKNDHLLKIGLSGLAIVGICCFTPILVIFLGALGLSAWVGWLDIVLFPLLALFAVVTAYAFWKRRQRETT